MGRRGPFAGCVAQVELVRRDYVANGGWETFLAYEDPQRDILVSECGRRLTDARPRGAIARYGSVC